MYGSRAEQEAFGHYLIEKAKKIGIYICPSSLNSYGERKCKPSGECVVYINESKGHVIKIKDPYAKAPMKGHASADAIYEHIVHNLLFSNTKYRLIGITESSIGDVRFVLEQKYMKDGFEPTSQDQIDKYLIENLHLNKDAKYWYGNEYFAITDVDATSDNVLTDDNGTLFFIDPIIKFKKTAKEVINSLSPQIIDSFAQTYILENELMSDWNEGRYSGTTTITEN